MEFAINEAEKNTETVTISREEYEAQQAKIAKLESRVEVLMEALRLAQHKLFGASSEKSDEAVMEQMSYLFNEAEVFAPTEEEATVTVPVLAPGGNNHSGSGENRQF